MDAVAQSQLASTILLNASFALMIGVLSARFWLLHSDKKNHRTVHVALQRLGVVAAALCLIASGAALWVAAAVMSGKPLAEASDMLGLMLTKTAYGQTGLIGLVLLALSVMFFILWGRARLYSFLLVIVLCAFALSRASVSHSGENGLFSLSVLVEWLHLVLIAVWVGGVAIAAWIVLPIARISSEPSAQQSTHLRPYMESLSLAAMLALIGIVATGLYNAWHRLESIDDLFGNAYGTALIIKFALVSVAILLGGYNKFIGFPAFARAPEKSHAMTVLRIESIVLFGVLIAAAVLTSQQPPASF